MQNAEMPIVLLEIVRAVTSELVHFGSALNGIPKCNFNSKLLRTYSAYQIA